MAYTFIIMRQDRTDRRPLSLNFPKAVLWGGVAVVALAPVLTAFLSYKFFAPSYLHNQVEQQSTILEERSEALEQLREANGIATQELSRVTKELDSTKEKLAKFETQVALAENARIEATSRAENMESELIALKRKVKLYENFITPATEKDVVQCFNIDANYYKGNVHYGVNFMKNDQKDKTKLESKVEFKVMTGADIANLSEVDLADAKADRKRTIRYTKDVRITGKFKADVPSEGIRVLDIRAYDAKSNKAIGHCWKAF